jgi:CRP-like cAMP-binding protein
MLPPTNLQLKQFRLQLRKFVEFTDEEWTVFSEYLYVRKIKKKELFASGHAICNEVGFIYSGSFRFFLLRDGIEISNYFCFQNELISSYRSFLKRVPGGVSIEAMEASEVVCFSHASLQKLLAHSLTAFRMEQFGRMIAEYLICCYEERVFSFLIQSPEERYASLLETQPAFLQRVPQHYLANYLGITPVSLSRIRKRIFSAAIKQKIAS